MKGSKIDPVIEPHERRVYHHELLLPYIHDYREKRQVVTQSAIKIAYFLDIFFLKNSVCKQVATLREKFGIPKEGLWLDKKTLGKIVTQSFYLPVAENSPLKEFRDLLKPIEESIPLQNFESMGIILRLFVLYDLYDIEFSSYLFSSEGICRVVNSREEWADYQPDNKKTISYYLKHLQQESEYYPLHIRLSPYASQRDIVDYIQANWKTIGKELKKMKGKEVLLGKIKKKDLERRERDKFMYENRDLPEKEIRKLLREYLGITIYQMEVRKIISREGKKRQDV